MKRLALILTLTLTLASAASVAAYPAGDRYTDPFDWKKCSQKVDFNLKITAARNMACRGAKSVMRRHEGSIARRFNAPSGFRCKLVKGRPISGIWRCTKSRKAFKFAFGD